ncbi:hypothetical protein AK88_01171 [Plasmodium fragile]|uniref:Uncharacterized protein n=1 Tax=Plasmodium fragile TaxID=5857 RepID=A0A0D9QPS7_PLAFR|nr:uncharacterized protein AK88_01171 [Plasmodium fragile]KJP89085.1 hypothetical protein AK88_01171 [Plasmodium fragile]
MALLLYLLEYLLQKLGVKKYIRGVKHMCMNSIKHFMWEELELTPFTLSLPNDLVRSTEKNVFLKRPKRHHKEKGAFGAYLAYLDTLTERKHQLSFHIFYVGRVDVDWGILPSSRGGGRSVDGRSGGVRDAGLYSGLTVQVENVFVSVKLEEEGAQEREPEKGQGVNKMCDTVEGNICKVKGDGEGKGSEDGSEVAEISRSFPVVALLIAIVYLNVVTTKLYTLACSLLKYIAHNIIKRSFLRIFKEIVSKLAMQYILCLDVKNINIIFEDTLSNGKKKIFLSVHMNEVHADNCSFIRSREREERHMMGVQMNRSLITNGTNIIYSDGDTLNRNELEDLFKVTIGQLSVYQDGRSQHISRSDISEDKFKYKFFFFYNVKVTHKRECLLKETTLLCDVLKDRSNQRYLLSVATPSIHISLSNDRLYTLYLFLYKYVCIARGDGAQMEGGPKQGRRQPHRGQPHRRNVTSVQDSLHRTGRMCDTGGMKLLLELNFHMEEFNVDYWYGRGNDSLCCCCKNVDLFFALKGGTCGPAKCSRTRQDGSVKNRALHNFTFSLDSFSITESYSSLSLIVSKVKEELLRFNTKKSYAFKKVMYNDLLDATCAEYASVTSALAGRYGFSAPSKGKNKHCLIAQVNRKCERGGSRSSEYLIGLNIECVSLVISRVDRFCVLVGALLERDLFILHHHLGVTSGTKRVQDSSIGGETHPSLVQISTQINRIKVELTKLRAPTMILCLDHTLLHFTNKNITHVKKKAVRKFRTSPNFLLAKKLKKKVKAINNHVNINYKIANIYTYIKYDRSTHVLVFPFALFFTLDRTTMYRVRISIISLVVELNSKVLNLLRKLFCGSEECSEERGSHSRTSGSGYFTSEEVPWGKVQLKKTQLCYPDGRKKREDIPTMVINHVKDNVVSIEEELNFLFGALEVFYDNDQVAHEKDEEDYYVSSSFSITYVLSFFINMQVKFSCRHVNLFFFLCKENTPNTKKLKKKKISNVIIFLQSDQVRSNRWDKAKGTERYMEAFHFKFISERTIFHFFATKKKNAYLLKNKLYIYDFASFCDFNIRSVPLHFESLRGVRVYSLADLGGERNIIRLRPCDGCIPGNVREKVVGRGGCYSRGAHPNCPSYALTLRHQFQLTNSGELKRQGVKNKHVIACYLERLDLYVHDFFLNMAYYAYLHLWQVQRGEVDHAGRTNHFIKSPLRNVFPSEAHLLHLRRNNNTFYTSVMKKMLRLVFYFIAKRITCSFLFMNKGDMVGEQRLSSLGAASKHFKVETNCLVVKMRSNLVSVQAVKEVAGVAEAAGAGEVPHVGASPRGKAHQLPPIQRDRGKRAHERRTRRLQHKCATRSRRHFYVCKLAFHMFVKETSVMRYIVEGQGVKNKGKPPLSSAVPSIGPYHHSPQRSLPSREASTGVVNTQQEYSEHWQNVTQARTKTRKRRNVFIKMERINLILSDLLNMVIHLNSHRVRISSDVSVLDSLKWYMEAIKDSFQNPFFRTHFPLNRCTSDRSASEEVRDFIKRRNKYAHGGMIAMGGLNAGEVYPMDHNGKKNITVCYKHIGTLLQVRKVHICVNRVTWSCTYFVCPLAEEGKTKGTGADCSGEVTNKAKNKKMRGKKKEKLLLKIKKGTFVFSRTCKGTTYSRQVVQLCCLVKSTLCDVHLFVKGLEDGKRFLILQSNYLHLGNQLRFQLPATKVLRRSVHMVKRIRSRVGRSKWNRTYEPLNCAQRTRHPFLPLLYPSITCAMRRRKVRLLFKMLRCLKRKIKTRKGGDASWSLQMQGGREPHLVNVKTVLKSYSSRGEKGGDGRVGCNCSFNVLLNERYVVSLVNLYACVVEMGAKAQRLLRRYGLGGSGAGSGDGTAFPHDSRGESRRDERTWSKVQGKQLAPIIRRVHAKHRVKKMRSAGRAAGVRLHSRVGMNPRNSPFVGAKKATQNRGIRLAGTGVSKWVNHRSVHLSQQRNGYSPQLTLMDALLKCVSFKLKNVFFLFHTDRENAFLGTYVGVLKGELTSKGSRTNKQKTMQNFRYLHELKELLLFSSNDYFDAKGKVYLFEMFNTLSRRNYQNCMNMFIFFLKKIKINFQVRNLNRKRRKYIEGVGAIGQKCNKGVFLIRRKLPTKERNVVDQVKETQTLLSKREGSVLMRNDEMDIKVLEQRQERKEEEASVPRRMGRKGVHRGRTKRCTPPPTEVATVLKRAVSNRKQLLKEYITNITHYETKYTQVERKNTVLFLNRRADVGVESTVGCMWRALEVIEGRAKMIARRKEINQSEKMSVHVKCAVKGNPALNLTIKHTYKDVCFFLPMNSLVQWHKIVSTSKMWRAFQFLSLARSTQTKQHVEGTEGRKKKKKNFFLSYHFKIFFANLNVHLLSTCTYLMDDVKESGEDILYDMSLVKEKQKKTRRAYTSGRTDSGDKRKASRTKHEREGNHKVFGQERTKELHRRKRGEDFFTVTQKRNKGKEEYVYVNTPEVKNHPSYVGHEREVERKNIYLALPGRGMQPWKGMKSTKGMKGTKRTKETRETTNKGTLVDVNKTHFNIIMQHLRVKCGLLHAPLTTHTAINIMRVEQVGVSSNQAKHHKVYLSLLGVRKFYLRRCRGMSTEYMQRPVNGGGTNAKQHGAHVANDDEQRRGSTSLQDEDEPHISVIPLREFCLYNLVEFINILCFYTRVNYVLNRGESLRMKSGHKGSKKFPPIFFTPSFGALNENHLSQEGRTTEEERSRTFRQNGYFSFPSKRNSTERGMTTPPLSSNSFSNYALLSSKGNGYGDRGRRNALLWVGSGVRHAPGRANEAMNTGRVHEAINTRRNNGQNKMTSGGITPQVGDTHLKNSKSDSNERKIATHTKVLVTKNCASIIVSRMSVGLNNNDLLILKFLLEDVEYLGRQRREGKVYTCRYSYRGVVISSKFRKGRCSRRGATTDGTKRGSKSGVKALNKPLSKPITRTTNKVHINVDMMKVSFLTLGYLHELFSINSMNNQLTLTSTWRKRKLKKTQVALNMKQMNALCLDIIHLKNFLFKNSRKIPFVHSFDLAVHYNMDERKKKKLWIYIKNDVHIYMGRGIVNFLFLFKQHFIHSHLSYHECVLCSQVSNEKIRTIRDVRNFVSFQNKFHKEFIIIKNYTPYDLLYQYEDNVGLVKRNEDSVIVCANLFFLLIYSVEDTSLRKKIFLKGRNYLSGGSPHNANQYGPHFGKAYRHPNDAQQDPHHKKTLSAKNYLHIDVGIHDNKKCIYIYPYFFVNILFDEYLKRDTTTRMIVGESTVAKNDPSSLKFIKANTINTCVVKDNQTAFSVPFHFMKQCEFMQLVVKMHNDKLYVSNKMKYSQFLKLRRYVFRDIHDSVHVLYCSFFFLVKKRARVENSRMDTAHVDNSRMDTAHVDKAHVDNSRMDTAHADKARVRGGGPGQPGSRTDAEDAKYSKIFSVVRMVKKNVHVFSIQNCMKIINLTPFNINVLLKREKGSIKTYSLRSFDYVNVYHFCFLNNLILNFSLSFYRQWIKFLKVNNEAYFARAEVKQDLFVATNRGEVVVQTRTATPSNDSETEEHENVKGLPQIVFFDLVKFHNLYFVVYIYMYEQVYNITIVSKHNVMNYTRNVLQYYVLNDEENCLDDLKFQCEVKKYNVKQTYTALKEDLLLLSPVMGRRVFALEQDILKIEEEEEEEKKKKYEQENKNENNKHCIKNYCFNHRFSLNSYNKTMSNDSVSYEINKSYTKVIQLNEEYVTVRVHHLHFHSFGISFIQFFPYLVLVNLTKYTFEVKSKPHDVLEKEQHEQQRHREARHGEQLVDSNESDDLNFSEHSCFSPTSEDDSEFDVAGEENRPRGGSGPGEHYERSSYLGKIAALFDEEKVDSRRPDRTNLLHSMSVQELNIKNKSAWDFISLKIRQPQEEGGGHQVTLDKVTHNGEAPVEETEKKMEQKALIKSPMNRPEGAKIINYAQALKVLTRKTHEKRGSPRVVKTKHIRGKYIRIHKNCATYFYTYKYAQIYTKNSNKHLTVVKEKLFHIFTVEKDKTYYIFIKRIPLLSGEVDGGSSRPIGGSHPSEQPSRRKKNRCDNNDGGTDEMGFTCEEAEEGEEDGEEDKAETIMKDAPHVEEEAPLGTLRSAEYERSLHEYSRLKKMNIDLVIFTKKNTMQQIFKKYKEQINEQVNKKGRIHIYNNLDVPLLMNPAQSTHLIFIQKRYVHFKDEKCIFFFFPKFILMNNKTLQLLLKLGDETPLTKYESVRNYLHLVKIPDMHKNFHVMKFALVCNLISSFSFSFFLFKRKKVKGVVSPSIGGETQFVYYELYLVKYHCDIVLNKNNDVNIILNGSRESQFVKNVFSLYYCFHFLKGENNIIGGPPPPCERVVASSKRNDMNRRTVPVMENTKGIIYINNLYGLSENDLINVKIFIKSVELMLTFEDVSSREAMTLVHMDQRIHFSKIFFNFYTFHCLNRKALTRRKRCIGFCDVRKPGKEKQPKERHRWGVRPPRRSELMDERPCPSRAIGGGSGEGGGNGGGVVALTNWSANLTKEGPNRECTNIVAVDESSSSPSSDQSAEWGEKSSRMRSSRILRRLLRRGRPEYVTTLSRTDNMASRREGKRNFLTRKNNIIKIYNVYRLFKSKLYCQYSSHLFCSYVKNVHLYKQLFGLLKSNVHVVSMSYSDFYERVLVLIDNIRVSKEDEGVEKKTFERNSHTILTKYNDEETFISVNVDLLKQRVMKYKHIYNSLNIVHACCHLERERRQRTRRRQRKRRRQRQTMVQWVVPSNGDSTNTARRRKVTQLAERMNKRRVTSPERNAARIAKSKSFATNRARALLCSAYYFYKRGKDSRRGSLDATNCGDATNCDDEANAGYAANCGDDANRDDAELGAPSHQIHNLVQFIEQIKKQKLRKRRGDIIRNLSIEIASLSLTLDYNYFVNVLPLCYEYVCREWRHYSVSGSEEGSSAGGRGNHSTRVSCADGVVQALLREADSLHKFEPFAYSRSLYIPTSERKKNFLLYIYNLDIKKTKIYINVNYLLKLLLTQNFLMNISAIKIKNKKKKKIQYIFKKIKKIYFYNYISIFFYLLKNINISEHSSSTTLNLLSFFESFLKNNLQLLSPLNNLYSIVVTLKHKCEHQLEHSSKAGTSINGDTNYSLNKHINPFFNFEANRGLLISSTHYEYYSQQRENRTSTYLKNFFSFSHPSFLWKNVFTSPLSKEHQQRSGTAVRRTILDMLSQGVPLGVDGLLQRPTESASRDIALKSKSHTAEGDDKQVRALHRVRRVPRGTLQREAEPRHTQEETNRPKHKKKKLKRKKKREVQNITHISFTHNLNIRK